MTASAPSLALDRITRRYGAVNALDSASLRVHAGEVHALLGENGAGKSTLMKIAYGLDQADAGTMSVSGRIARVRSPRQAMALGIGMVQQHFALVDAMTVAENVALGGTERLKLDQTRATIRRIADVSGLALDPDALVRDLTVASRQRVEIVKALARETQILILDEPTAVLAPHEAMELLAWTRRFADAGGSVILIAHKLREVLRVADRVTVLRLGRTVLATDTATVSESTITDAMLGAAGAAMFRRPQARANHTADTRPVVTLANVTVRDTRGIERLRNASIALHAGEILGVAAVDGDGQHELLRVMAGRLQPTSGTVALPHDVGFAPEDRQRDAVVLDATLTENVALSGAHNRQRVMPWNAIHLETQRILSANNVRAQSPAQPMRTLSGGNQQKLVLGRELANAPTAIVVDNPTRGLDIRATAEVHGALREARDRGVGVVVYSSDLDEVLGLADRMVVVAGGRLREVPLDRDAVGRAMLIEA